MHLRKAAGTAGLITLLWFALPSVASADVDKGINSIRQRGCEGKRGLRDKLQRSRGLDEVARVWSKGGRLREAIAKTDYRIANSSSMRIANAKNEQALLQLVASSYCGVVLNPEFTEIGVYERSNTAWIVVALPLTLPTTGEMPQVATRVLALVNEARVQARRCGSRSFARVPPLKLSTITVARSTGACEGHECEQALRASRVGWQHARGARDPRRLQVGGGRARTLPRARRLRKRSCKAGSIARGIA